MPSGTLQFVVFLAVAAVVIPFGVTFVSGPAGVGGKLILHARMDDAFGLSKGTGVTVRGVDVGSVDSVDLAGDGHQGADITLSVRGGTRIPRDSYIQVTMATMAGIQSVDIISARANGPYLRNGDTIAAPGDKQPMQMDAVISSASRVLASFGSGSVTTVGNELYDAVSDDPGALDELVGNGIKIADLVSRNAPMLTGLFGQWLSLLDAMDRNRSAFEQGMSAAASFTDQLDSGQPIFVYLLDHSPEALDKATALFDKYRGTFGGLLANLASVEPVISTRSAALRTGLDTIPQGLLDLRSIVKNGRADFALVGTQGPVCMYYDEPRRAVGDLTPSAPNLARYCPPGDAYGQRGAVNAPRPDELGTSTWTAPGGVSGPAAVRDPLLIPDGATLLQQWRDLLERTKSNGN